ncbi:MAG: terminase family protein [Candidatus Cloacimonetes bacterium]|nr:terminase family protein [Candidatus Cloacimonadota bacterium]
MNKYIEILAPYIKKILYSYQLKFLADDSRWRIVNKSRQIGFSLSLALDAISGALVRERNQLIVSASKKNAEVVMNYVRWHLEGMNMLAAVDKEGFIELANGKHLMVCSTNWRTARGFNGDVYLDEFAFTIRDKEIWQAIVPSITAVSGRVTVVSTPKSRIDKFWQIYDGKSSKWSKHCITIHDAIRDGFPVDIDELRELFDPEEFAQAYECIPLDTAESYIPYTLIEPCIYDPLSEAFEALVLSMPESKGKRSYVYGVDIGRTKDETAVAETFRHDMVTWCAGIQSWQKMPFRTQKERLLGLAGNPCTELLVIDKGGIGMNLHEDLAFAFPSKIRGVSFAPAVKERMAKKLKIAFEEKKIRIPNDPSLISHILSIRRSANKTSTFSYNTEDSEHHGDKFWALALAYDWTCGNKIIDFRFM